MKGDHPASRASGVARSRAPGSLATLASRGSGLRLAVVAALGAVLPITLARFALNAPVALPLPNVAGSVDALVALATIGPAVAAVVVGLSQEDVLLRVGLLSAGVFAALPVVDAAATLPAAGALVLGGAFVLRPLGRSSSASRATPTASLVLLALAAGLAGSLLAATGTDPVGVRTLGGVAVAAGLAGLPLLVRPVDRRAWVAGAAVAATVFAAGVAAPFVTGAAVLVVWGAVGVPLGLLALGAGGAATIVADAALSGRLLPATGGLLLLSAGVPASVQRAVAFVLGVSLVATYASDAMGPDSGSYDEDGQGVTGGD